MYYFLPAVPRGVWDNHRIETALSAGLSRFEELERSFDQSLVQFEEQKVLVHSRVDSADEQIKAGHDLVTLKFDELIVQKYVSICSLNALRVTAAGRAARVAQAAYGS